METEHSIAADVRRHRALGHPVRQQILTALKGGRVATPKELAAELGLPLARTSYHVGVLREKKALELVRTEPARGSLRHFYRATMELDGLEPQVELASLELDEQGRKEVAALLADTNRAIEAVQARAAKRLKKKS